VKDRELEMKNQFRRHRLTIRRIVNLSKVVKRWKHRKIEKWKEKRREN